MQRVTEIIASVFIFFFAFLKNLTLDLYHAIYFRALEYDSELQQTKTSMQRVGIWSVIVVVTMLIIILLLNLTYYFLNNLNFVLGPLGA